MLGSKLTVTILLFGIHGPNSEVKLMVASLMGLGSLACDGKVTESPEALYSYHLYSALFLKIIIVSTK